MNPRTAEFLEALVAASDRDQPSGTPKFTEQDLIDTFGEQALADAAEAVYHLDGGGEVVLHSKFGSDDPRYTDQWYGDHLAPLQLSPATRTWPKTPEGWEVSLHPEAVTIRPVGGGAGGEATILWLAVPIQY